MCDKDVCGVDDFNTYDGRPTWGTLIIRVVILYVVVGYFCWEELYFRRSSVNVNAQVEMAGTSAAGRAKVRYRFITPDTGRTHFNTVTVSEHQKPVGNTAIVQYIPGETPRSRLASQARPGMVTFFYWWNGIMAVIVVGYLGYAAWEFHYDPLRHLSPKDRALARFKKRREVEKQLVR